MALADDIITSINASLLANLDWLNSAYGKVQKLQRKTTTGKIVHYPAVYVGGETKDYIDLLPDQTTARNYSYFEVIDGMAYESTDRQVKPSFKFKIVFWFYWPDLYNDWQDRSIEEVKAQVFNVLTATPYSRMIEVFTTYEDARSIYEGYTHNEIDQQFLMREYGGFSIEGELYGAALCNLSLPTPTIPANLFALIPANYSTTKQLFPLKKWFGQKIWWQTWIIGDGTDDYVELTGLNVADVDIIIDSEHHSKNTVDSTIVTGPADIKPIDGVYHAFTSAQQEINYITVYFTEN